MTVFHAIVLGIIEGLTEFLPVSSTGHLILATKILQIPESEFLKSFEIIIQLGGILAVLSLYFRTIFFERKIFLRLVIAFFPSAFLGLLLYTFIRDVLFENTLVISIALFVGGVLLIFFEHFYKEKENHITHINALSLRRTFGIGLFQTIAMIPGVSRSAATILGGVLFGLERKKAVEFSFLLAIPTIFGASGLDLIKNQFQFTREEYILLGIGFGVAFFTAWLSVKFFLKFIEQHNTFTPFGIYRILIALTFFIVTML